MVTIEMLTGLVIPAPGRISTVPSMRGYITCQHNRSCATDLWNVGTHQGGRDTRIPDQKVCVRTARHSHKCAHLLVEPEPILGPLPRGREDALCKRALIGLEFERCGGLGLSDSVKPMRRQGCYMQRINDECVGMCLCYVWLNRLVLDGRLCLGGEWKPGRAAGTQVSVAKSRSKAGTRRARCGGLGRWS
jgi:hypothetical protein